MPVFLPEAGGIDFLREEVFLELLFEIPFFLHGLEKGIPA